MRSMRLPLAPSAFEPLVPSSLQIGPLLQRAELLLQASSLLRQLVAVQPPETAPKLRQALLRSSAVASNRMEGEVVAPTDLQHALEGHFSSDQTAARGQRLVVAHMAAEGSYSLPIAWADHFSARELQLLHGQLFAGLESGAGELRRQEVAVGRHLAPTHTAVPEFINRWAEVMTRSSAPAALAVVATAASHQRLAWIHPFVDGNGRMARLHTHHALGALGLAPDLWSPIRAFARTAGRYRQRIADADLPRRHDFDGRGPLSDEGLAQWVDYALEAWIDQVRLVSRIVKRIRI